MNDNKFHAKFLVSIVNYYISYFFKTMITIIINLSCLTSLDSSKPIQKRISVNHEGLSRPITT